MFNLKNLFTRALLALMLVSGAGAAAAGPIYHVTIDTAGLSGTGVFDFLFSGDATSAGEATVTLSNPSGDFGANEAFGDIRSGGSSLVLGNTGGYAELLQTVNLGGVFGVDLRFDVAPAGDGTTLGIALYNEALDAYLGLEGNLAQFELVPGGMIGVSDDNALTRIVAVSEVPEPAAIALLALGLALMAWTARARRMH
jgi:opacity protein-like surface antigen